MMKLYHYRPILLVLVAASIVLSGVKAQICVPPGISAQSTFYFYTSEGFSFPTDYTPFNVSDHQHRGWTLQLNAYSFTAYLIDSLAVEVTYASLYATLYDTRTGTGYLIRASGEFSPFGIRGSPDFKWLTLFNIDMRGSSLDNSLSFNVSISYADFWSDTPPNDVYNQRDIYIDDSGCKTVSAVSGGYNSLPSKGFWIAFYFDDGRQLFFNVPAGPNGVLNRAAYNFLTEECFP